MMLTSLTLTLAGSTLIGGVTITLPQTIEVSGTEITLGQIAEITGDDVLDVVRARELALGYAPAPGYSRLIGRDLVIQGLRAQAADLECTFAGAAVCRVTPAVTLVKASDLRAAAERALGSSLAGADFEITLKGPLGDVSVPRPKQTVELRAAVRESGGALGSWSVPIEIVLDGDVYRTIWSSWTVEEWRTLPVLNTRVTRGLELTPDMFTLRRIRVGSGRNASALDPATFGRATAVRDLPAGSVVTDRDVQRAVVVRRGDIVSLEVKKGAITARALAFAKQDGRVGDRVRVETASAGRIIIAEVVAKDLVRIEID
ncbi:MAG: flagellar basal body P-ring formation protein FlgA [bacterium]|nr:flagellar basal body P-ring formation protein FlgA [bacterium]